MSNNKYSRKRSGSSSNISNAIAGNNGVMNNKKKIPLTQCVEKAKQTHSYALNINGTSNFASEDKKASDT